MAAGPSNISKLIEEEPKLSDTELLQAVGKELPEINIDTSSDESRDHYLPESEVTHEEVKSGFSQLFESIRSKFKSDSPNISQVGLQPSRSDITPTSTPKIKFDNLEYAIEARRKNEHIIENQQESSYVVEQSSKLSPLNIEDPNIKNLASSSDLFNATADLFDNEDDDVLQSTEDLTSNKKGISYHEIGDKEKLQEIIEENSKLDSETFTQKVKEAFPEYNEEGYREEFMKAIDQLIDEEKTPQAQEKSKKEFIETDLKELEKIAGSSDTKDIKNAVRENYTVNKLLKEVKSKASSLFKSEAETIDVESDEPDIDSLTKLIGKGKSLDTFEDLPLKHKEAFEKAAAKIKPDELLEKLSGVSNYKEDTFTNHLVCINVDESLEQISINNPGLSKQETIEKLISENPLHKNEIFELISKNVDKHLSNWKDNMSEEDFNKAMTKLGKEDLSDLQSLSEKRSIDQIKTLTSVNRSHNRLLNEIKSKASKSSFNTEQVGHDETNPFE